MGYSPTAATVANAIDRWNRKARRAHREAPEGVRVPNRRETISLLLERDGDKCACGCGVTLDLDKGVEIEHRVPLWKVAHLPEAERAKYFEPGNLGLYRKKPCHQKKSARETTERAHHARVLEKELRHQERMSAKAEIAD